MKINNKFIEKRNGCTIKELVTVIDFSKEEEQKLQHWFNQSLLEDAINQYHPPLINTFDDSKPIKCIKHPGRATSIYTWYDIILAYFFPEYVYNKYFEKMDTK